MNEQQMRDLVDRVGDTLQPDIAGLVAGGTARGRVRRRRRTAGAIVSGVAAVAAVGAIGLALVPGDGGRSGTDGVPVASSPTPGTSDFGPAPEQTGEVLAERLREIVGGEATEPRSWVEENPDPRGPAQRGSVLLDGALVEIWLFHAAAPECGGDGPPYPVCEVLPGGVLTSTGTSEWTTPGIFETSAVHYFTDDGVAVQVTAWNAADTAGAPALSTAPLVTQEQLFELVQDPAWLAPSSQAAAEPDRHFGPDPGKMGWVLGDLLDGEVTERRSTYEDLPRSGSYQAGSVLLDGARVTLILQHTPPQDGCGDLPPGRPCDVVPGGLMTGGSYEEPASGGGSTGIFASTATYFTADGFSITATAWNAPGEKDTDPVMAQPVLSEEQLYDLVRDPVWLDAPR